MMQVQTRSPQSREPYPEVEVSHRTATVPGLPKSATASHIRR
ncbi:hypothetical protein [Almyronema epifaneia]|uniref:Uncharacterized protein n=1 Tax=Almyronema epifaneia S1 TaxID=2991925 RepID=A0ABW6IJA6_9CYAN